MSTSTRPAVLVIGLLTVALPSVPQNPPPPEAPQFIIEPGSHSRPIRAIAVDDAETLAVTGSDDRTVRLWDLKNGHLSQTVYLPVEANNPFEGRVYAVAVSHEGDQIAYAGHTGFAWRKDKDGNSFGSYFTFDRAKNSVISHPAFYQDIRSLSFTPRGRDGYNYLVYSTGSAVGIANSAKNYDSGNAFQVVGGIAADVMRANGRDLLIMLYRPPGDKTSGFTFRTYLIGADGLQLQGESGRFPYAADSVRFTPDGKYFVVSVTPGGSQPRGYLLYDGRTLNFLGQLQTQGTPIGPAYAMPDSSGFAVPTVLVAGQDRSTAILRWKAGATVPQLSKLQEFEDGDAPENGIITPLKNGRFIWSSKWGEWQLFGDKGVATDVYSDFDSIDLDEHDDIAVSNDGSEIYFKNNDPDADDKRPMIFSIRQRSLKTGTRLGPPPIRSFKTGTPSFPGLDTVGLRYNGVPLPIPVANKNLKANSWEVDDVRGIVYVGSLNEVYAFKGQSFLWRTTTLGAKVVQLRATPNGKLVFAVLQDGTFRWISTTDGRLVLSAFVSGGEGDWIAWTTDGYYDASPGGEDLGGYLTNSIAKSGRPFRAVFSPVSRFHNRFYNPDLVASVLTGAPAKPTVTSGAPISRGDPLGQQPSVASTDPVLEVAVKVDNRVLDKKDYTVGTPAQSGGLSSADPVITLRIPSASCNVSVVARNKFGWGTPDTIKVTWKGQETRPKLWVLAIGTSTFENPGVKQLPSAVRDATGMLESLNRQAPTFYSEVHEIGLITPERPASGSTPKPVTLPNKVATKANIEDALEDLAKNAKSGDQVVVFIAGHGIADAQGAHYFVPYDFNPDHYLRSALTFDEIVKEVASIKARVVVFLDTCHSGAVNDAALSAYFDIVSLSSHLSDTDPDKGGAVVFTATTGRQNALERPEWGHGAFTKALLEGLSGAGMDERGQIRLVLLNNWVSRRVGELTGCQQTPIFTSRGAPDFAIGRATKQDVPPPKSCD